MLTARTRWSFKIFRTRVARNKETSSRLPKARCCSRRLALFSLVSVRSFRALLTFAMTFGVITELREHA